MTNPQIVIGTTHDFSVTLTTNVDLGYTGWKVKTAGGSVVASNGTPNGFGLTQPSWGSGGGPYTGTVTLSVPLSATPGTGYVLEVQAALYNSGSGTFGYPFSTFVKPTFDIVALSPPSPSQSTGTSPVHLEWTAVSNATSYNVYRSLAGAGSWTLLGNTSGVHWVDATGVSGTLYDYAVSSLYNSAEGAKSAPATALWGYTLSNVYVPGAGTVLLSHFESKHGCPAITGSSNPRVLGATANPHQAFSYMAEDPFSFYSELEDHKDEQDGAFGDKRKTKVANIYDAYQLPIIGDPNNLDNALLAMFGAVKQTGVDATTGAYINEFRPNTKFGRQPSRTFEQRYGDGTYAALLTGCLSEKLELGFDKTLRCTETIRAFHGLPNNYPHSGADTDYAFGSTAATIPDVMNGDGTKTWKATASPTFADFGTVFTFANLAYGSESGFSSTFLKVDGSGYSHFAPNPGDLSISVEREIFRAMVPGSSWDDGAAVGLKWHVMGRLATLFVDEALQAAARRRAQFALNFKINCGAISGSSPSTNSYIEVHIPEFYFKTAKTTGRTKELKVSADWEAVINSAAGYAIKVTLVNGVDHSSLGGLAGTSYAAGVDGNLGLGGWDDSAW